MLVYLRIRNIAIIDELEVEFHDGFNVLTGETGAGKSIIIGALQMLLGGKSSSESIRSGENEAVIEALFEIPTNMGFPELEEYGRNENGELLLVRKLLKNGKSRCSINGRTATLSMLEFVGKALVNIFGQHEHRLLLDPSEHIAMLDAYGKHESILEKVAAAYDNWRSGKKTLEIACREMEELEKRKETIAFQISELSEANVTEGEEESLVEERDILKKAVQIREKAYEAYQSLYSKSGSLIGGLTEVGRVLDYLAASSKRFTELRDGYQEAFYKIEDTALELRNISEKFQADPQRLDAIEERLMLLKRLKKKYGRDIAGLVDYLDSLISEENKITNSTLNLKQLQAAESEAWQLYVGLSDELTEKRQSAARDLEIAIADELSELAMSEARLKVFLSKADKLKPRRDGFDEVEFLLSSNPGESPRPLSKIASGGELSRIMLSLKALQVDGTAGITVIFDEVDTGIGGHTALAVGTRLARVGKYQQVLCVTHLHQVAANADHHLSVQKQVKNGRTSIIVQALDDSTRVDELARMLGADPNSDTAREHVKQLIGISAGEAPN